MKLPAKDLQLLRLSLVFVWLATAIVSLWEFKGQSTALLADAGLHDPALAGWLILGGAALDALLGLAMLFKPGRQVYLAALAAMLLMTLVATLMDASLWLHPLGPLIKNIPMAAALLILARADKS